MFPEDAKNADELLKRTDKALYAVKISAETDSPSFMPKWKSGLWNAL